MPSAERWPFHALPGNARTVLNTLRRRGPATRAELAEAAGLSRATVSVALARLVREGLVDQSGESMSAGPSGGRPPSLIRLGPAAGLAVGVDVGRAHLRVAVADLGHQVRAEDACTLRGDVRAEAVLDLAAQLVRSCLDRIGHDMADVIGVGLGMPAPVEQRTGRVLAPAILPDWAHLCAGPELSARLGRPVMVDNDANLGALAEHMWGAGRGHGTIAYIKAATGIGGGLVLGGRLFRGRSGTAGELGHVVLDENGGVCRCGNRGCLELVAGGTALVAALRGSNRDVTSLPDLIRHVRAGDTACVRIVADAGTHIGVAVGSLVNLVNPERVIVGGELGQAGEVLLEPMRRALRRCAVSPAVQAVEVVPCALEDRSEVLGAVAGVLCEPEWVPDATTARVG
ncbi:MAG TPA: ROK family transcriptional regulator [Mycobacteriales bacterium]|nr:ROK family transcriptional regulator [Mycobacteriales bacterium]